MVLSVRNPNAWVADPFAAYERERPRRGYLLLSEQYNNWGKDLFERNSRKGTINYLVEVDRVGQDPGWWRRDSDDTTMSMASAILSVPGFVSLSFTTEALDYPVTQQLVEFARGFSRIEVLEIRKHEIPVGVGGAIRG